MKCVLSRWIILYYKETESYTYCSVMNFLLLSLINLSISNSNSKFNSRRIRYLVTLLYFCEYNFWSLFSLTCSSMIIKEWPTTLGFCDIGNPITAFSIHFSSTHICLIILWRFYILLERNSRVHYYSKNIN
jgi:hypothetical protein